MAQMGNRSSFPPEEDALPKGHPCRPDYDPESTEAKVWRAKQETMENSSGMPPGYTADPNKPHGGLVWARGVDPLRPHLEPLTGLPRRTKPTAKPTDSATSTQ